MNKIGTREVMWYLFISLQKLQYQRSNEDVGTDTNGNPRPAEAYRKSPEAFRRWSEVFRRSPEVFRGFHSPEGSLFRNMVLTTRE